ncbi:hypothetical protein G5I_08570 [Acromyrmex echinatior]|uniref:Uncharacterized protein n=1 Tax=Acromyrmex echinatior TaxID=103372 RepID=F4WRW6_ACREC|nr:hypothetical protein G5I_08570 [Acromyrmex echinatior]
MRRRESESEPQDSSRSNRSREYDHSTSFPLLVCAPLSQLYSYHDDIRSIGKLRGADAAVPACRSRIFVCVRCSHHRIRATHTSAKALPRPAECGEWNTSASTLRAALPPRGGVGSEQPPSSDSDDNTAHHQQQGAGYGQNLDSYTVPKVKVSGPSNADESASIINGMEKRCRFLEIG